MKIDIANYEEHEIEEQRQETLVEIYKKQKSDETAIRERYCNPYGYREALHTGFIQHEVVSHYLCEHPCVALDAEAYRWAWLAQHALFELYQRMGRLESESDAK